MHVVTHFSSWLKANIYNSNFDIKQAKNYRYDLEMGISMYLNDIIKLVKMCTLMWHNIAFSESSVPLSSSVSNYLEQ